MHDKSVYEVKCTDGTTEKLTDNIIAENKLSQVDFEGNHYKVFIEVTDHKRDVRSRTKANGFIKSINGNLQHKRKNRVCKLLVECKDRSVDWIPQKDLKQSNPVELA